MNTHNSSSNPGCGRFLAIIVALAAIAAGIFGYRYFAEQHRSKLERLRSEKAARDYERWYQHAFDSGKTIVAPEVIPVSRFLVVAEEHAAKNSTAKIDEAASLLNEVLQHPGRRNSPPHERQMVNDIESAVDPAWKNSSVPKANQVTSRYQSYLEDSVRRGFMFWLPAKSELRIQEIVLTNDMQEQIIKCEVLEGENRGADCYVLKSLVAPKR